MQVIAVLMLISAFGYGVMTLIYFVEAVRQSLAQAALMVVIPFYALYFAYVKSAKSMPNRLVLVACMLVHMAVTTIRIAMLSNHAA